MISEEEMFIKNQIRKCKREIFRSVEERRSFNRWNDYESSEFHRYNETERVILYFRVHLGVLDRKEISKRTGIREYQIKKFVKEIKTQEETYWKVGGTD
jgi:hypothetical protein